jgi:hypothetical protein
MIVHWMLLGCVAVVWAQADIESVQKRSAQSSVSDLAVSISGRTLRIEAGAVRIGNTTHNLKAASVSITAGKPENPGTCRVYVSDHGSIIIECPAAANLKFGPCQNCTVAPIRTPAVPEGAVPIADVRFEPGGEGGMATWEAVTDTRAFLSNRSMQSGTGMLLTGVGGVTTVAVDTATIPTLGGANPFTGSVRMHAAEQTAPHRLAAQDPEKCDPQIRETYRNTTTNHVRVCVGKGRWIDEPSGAATVHDESWFPAAGGGWVRSRNTVASKWTGGDLEWDTLAFGKDGRASAVLQYRLPATWKGSVAAELLFTADTGGVARWGFETACTSAGDVLGAGVFGSAEFAEGREPRAGILTSVAAGRLKTSQCRPGGLLLIRVVRAGQDGRDTLNGIAHVLGLRIAVSRDAVAAVSE